MQSPRAGVNSWEQAGRLTSVNNTGVMGRQKNLNVFWVCSAAFTDSYVNLELFPLISIETLPLIISGREHGLTTLTCAITL